VPQQLAELFLPLRNYADLHRGNFPNVAAAQPPRNVPAIVYPVLHDAKLMPVEQKLNCPGSSPDGGQAMTLRKCRQWTPLRSRPGRSRCKTATPTRWATRTVAR